MSSYVLSYSLITAKELIKLSLVFINNNFLFKSTFFYIREQHRQHLFNRFCQELWLENKNHNSEQIIEENSLNLKLLSKNNMEVNEDTIFNDNWESDAETINYSDIEVITGTTEVDFGFTKIKNLFIITVEMSETEIDRISKFYNEVEDLKTKNQVLISKSLSKMNFLLEYSDLQDVTHFYDTVDPYLVFSNSNLGPITEGIRFRVSGRILYNCERFQINLLMDTPTNDIALHINPRLPQNYIVRNCRLKNYWGREENSSHVPFTLKRGNHFSIQILVTKEEYLISIDDKHYAGFCHRVPFNRVKCLEVKGGVDDIECNITRVTEYPTYRDDKGMKENLQTDIKRDNTNRRSSKSIKLPKKYIISKTKNIDNDSSISYNTIQRESQILILKQKHYDADGIKKGLSLPFYGSLSDHFINGKSLRFEGRIKILPHSFFINLQNGNNIWPHPIIAFHFNPRFAMAEGKHVICRNSWFDNKWSQEERSELDTEFTPGRPFTLVFMCKENHYEIYLNNQIIAEYKHRVDPIIVDTVYIQGDIKLWEISLE